MGKLRTFRNGTMQYGHCTMHPLDTKVRIMDAKIWLLHSQTDQSITQPLSLGNRSRRVNHGTRGAGSDDGGVVGSLRRPRRYPPSKPKPREAVHVRLCLWCHRHPRGSLWKNYQRYLMSRDEPLCDWIYCQNETSFVPCMREQRHKSIWNRE